MSKLLSTEIEELKIIYSEIINGYSFIEERGVYLKHLNELENGELARTRLFLFDKYKKEGVSTEEEKIKQLIISEAWTQEEEDLIIDYKYQISDNEKEIKKIILQQRPPIQKVIDNIKSKLQKLLQKRRYVLGLTAEELAERETLNYLIFLSFFKNSALTDRVFTIGLEDLEASEIDPYTHLIEKNIHKFTDNNLRKIAILPFFLNPFSFCKDSFHSFLGKPICQLNSYQLFLFSMGSRNLNILSSVENEPPQLIDKTTVQDVVDWFDKQASILESKRNSKNKSN